MSVYYADFETVVYEGQTETSVWCGAIVEENSNDAMIFRSITQLIAILDNGEYLNKVYFHNLKFDGSFILNWLDRNGFKLALKMEDGEEQFENKNKLKKYEYTCFINRKGIWYDICVKLKKSIIEFKDSLKVLPFSVSKLGPAFQTEHRKTEIEYTGFRTSYTKMTKEEKEYVKNDVLVVKEAMSKFRAGGYKNDTIGGCALSFYKHEKLPIIENYDKTFPNLYLQEIDKEVYGSESVGDYVLKSYSGAFVYINPEKKRKEIRNGHTLDVTSLYPSRMHSCSGIEYPVGNGKMGQGKGEKKKGMYFFQRIECEFHLKDGYLPFVKIKNSYKYNATECLETSDITVLDKKIRNRVQLCFTQTELELFLDHYDVVDLKYLDYVQFFTMEKLFDDYVVYWVNLKNNAPNKVMRTISKLFLNSLYGKFASSPIANFKVPYISEKDGTLKFREVDMKAKNPGYIPIGSAIISEGRVFTIRACQANYYKGGDGFCYCDTDSIHLDIPLSKVRGLVIADNTLNTFKHESSWDIAFYDNEKRYIEHITHEGTKEVKPYYNITCAGLPDRGKLLMCKSMGDQLSPEEEEEINRKLTEKEKKFLSKKRKITDFTTGISIPGKLLKKTIKGGVILYEGEFTIRE